MEREIKFRVYDKISKQMYLWNQIASISLVDFEKEHYELMQFTGIKDKKVFNVYEGDILEFKNELGAYKIHKVFRVCGGLVINSHNDDVNKENNPFYEACADMQTSQWISQCKIIGNIYQNPETLTQKQLRNQK